MSDYILETSDLTKEFKGFTAVSKVNLKVRRGSPTAHREAETAKAHRG